MDITSARYAQNKILNDSDELVLDGVNKAIIAMIDGVQMDVPLDPANRHYAEIMRQVDAGTLTIQEAD
ncbi:MAG: hypothetical protein ACO23H_05285 [Alphaproteobacteria bacterium]